MTRSPTRTQAAEAAFHTIPPATFSGLHFQYRDAHFDWRLMHGIDVDSVVRLTDVHAIEDCLDTLQHGSLEGERSLSVRNCAQLLRLLQLAIEYVAHLRNAHALLMARYDQATAYALRWSHSAQSYQQLGELFLEECVRMSAMSMQRLEQVDQARAELEEQDRAYNEALEVLEAEDQQVRYFHFRKQRAELNWQQVHAIDLDELIINVDTGTLDKVMHNITFGSILGEDSEELTPHHFSQLVPLAQCALDYVLFQANATGALLDKAMAQLRGACAGVPALTSSTQLMHDRVMGLVIEAHSVSSNQQQQGGGGPALQHGLSAGQAAAFQLQGQGQLPLPPRARTTPGPLPTFARTLVSLPGSRPGTAGPALTGAFSPAGGGGGPGSPAPPPLHLYEDVLLSVSGRGGGREAAAGLLPAREMQSRTAELHFKVDELEKDLRMERFKTEEMRRILSDIRDRIVPAAAAAAGGPEPLFAGPSGAMGSSNTLNESFSRPSAPGGPERGAAGGGGGGLPARKMFSDAELLRAGGSSRNLDLLGPQAEALLRPPPPLHKVSRSAVSHSGAGHQRHPSGDGRAGGLGLGPGQVSDGSGNEQRGAPGGRGPRPSTGNAQARGRPPKPGHRSSISLGSAMDDPAAALALMDAGGPSLQLQLPSNAHEGVAYMRAASAAAAAGGRGRAPGAAPSFRRSPSSPPKS